MQPRHRGSTSTTGNEQPLDPVSAYDRIAPIYRSLSERRRAYLDRIERLIIEKIPIGSAGMLDIGAGDGLRAQRIAEAAGIAGLTLLEPSAAMRDLWGGTPKAWPLRAEELHLKDGAFDVITCLWNVLGHVFPEPKRAEVLGEIARLLSPSGLAFIDVNNRENRLQYPNLPDTGGDLAVTWNVAGQDIVTKGHVFTDEEFRCLAYAAGLKLQQMFVVDYVTGEVCQSKFSGNLLYVLSPRALE